MDTPTMNSAHTAQRATGNSAQHITGTVVTPTGVLTHHTLTFADGRIAAIKPAVGNPEPNEPLILPGFADLHNHGGAGESFPTSTLEGCRKAARHHRLHGSTTLLASTVSEVEEKLIPQLGILAELAEQGEIDGIHAEGPFVNECKCGAQNPAAIVPGDPAFFQRMCEAARGYLRSMTFAPETAHVREIIDLCARYNVVASLGHTAADFDTTAKAVEYAADQGVTVTATHLFNAMPQIHHRAPGAAAAMIAAAASKSAHVELIADGVHLDDHTVDMVMAAVGPARITFVSDAMGAAGKADGSYQLGALDVTVSGGVARLTTSDGSPGAIAGGTSRIIDQVRRQIAAGHSLDQVLTAATSGHALIGNADRGALVVGNHADFVVCDSGFGVQAVYRDGQQITALPED